MPIDRPTQPAPPEPMEINTRLVCAIGTALWLIALVILVVVRLAGDSSVNSWIAVCAAGVALGGGLWVYLLLHDR